MSRYGPIKPSKQWLLDDLSSLSECETDAVKHLLLDLKEIRKTTRDKPKLSYISVAKGIYCSRRTREKNFHPNFFSDPAWDMLLVLYCEGPPRGAVSVSSLCHASGSPQSTSLRALHRMCQAGWVLRYPHATDRRMTMLNLSAAARQKIEASLDTFIAMQD